MMPISVVITAGNEQDYFAGKSSGELSNPIPLDTDSTTAVYVVVTDGDVEHHIHTGNE